MIPFNKPAYTGNEDQHVLAAMRSSQISGEGPYTKKCQAFFKEWLECSAALLTPSCTHALEMAAILIDIMPGDEVIMPSYTFVSTANAFVLRGAKVVFVDIRSDTMNINEALIENAITEKTKAIVVVHYAGVACEMDVVMGVARRHRLYVIEDAAQAMNAKYKGKMLGTIGDLGAYSFHETKNYTSGGEGGLLIINNSDFSERSEVIRDKGTNRNQFFRGMIDKYSWVDVGSSYLMSDIQAAYLWGQLEALESIHDNRMNSWLKYRECLHALLKEEVIQLPFVPDECEHNAHIFYLKFDGIVNRARFIEYLNRYGIMAVFHYVPLHGSIAGKNYGFFHGNDRFTTSESERIVRLPLYHNMRERDLDTIINVVKKFF